jgi:hypothetical protein
VARSLMLVAALTALLSGACRQAPSQSARSAPVRPKPPADYTIWQKPVVDPVAQRNFAVPLRAGQPLARRFRTPAPGECLQGALYVVGTGDPEGRSWTMVDIAIAVCRDVAIYLGAIPGAATGRFLDAQKTGKAETVATIRVPPKGKITRVPFTLDYELAGGTDYWLVVQQIVVIPDWSDATQPLPLWVRGPWVTVAAPWGETGWAPDPLYLVQARESADAVIWAASEPAGVRPVVLRAPAFAAELKLLRQKKRLPR